MIVTVSCLGNNGRFGNQLFQYAFARAYAESIGAELQIPNWHGRNIFKNINEKTMTAPAGISTEFPNGESGIDLYGYFQQPEHLKLLNKSTLKEWFSFKEDIDVPYYDLIFHKRRGDYLNFSSVFAIVSDKSYEDSATSHGFEIDNAVCLDDSRPDDLLLYDFRTMMNCQTLFRSNSTFAWWAATLGTCQVYSPVVKNHKGTIDTEFVLGNNEPLGDFTGSMFIS